MSYRRSSRIKQSLYDKEEYAWHQNEELSDVLHEYQTILESHFHHDNQNPQIPTHLLNMASRLLFSILSKITLSCDLNDASFIYSAMLWSPSSKPGTIKENTPAWKDEIASVYLLKKFIKECKISLVTFIMSLVLLYRYWCEKISNKSHSYPRKEMYFSDILEEKTTETTKEDSFSLSSFKIFMASVMIMDKYFYDRPYSNMFWKEVYDDVFNPSSSLSSSVTLPELNFIERQFLDMIQFNVYISTDDFNHFINCLKAKFLITELSLRYELESISYREMFIFTSVTEENLNSNNDVANFLLSLNEMDCDASRPLHHLEKKEETLLPVVVNSYYHPMVIFYHMLLQVFVYVLMYIVFLIASFFILYFLSHFFLFSWWMVRKAEGFIIIMI